MMMNWWWWIVFVVWLTDERRLALFPAGTIVRDSHPYLEFQGYHWRQTVFFTWKLANKLHQDCIKNVFLRISRTPYKNYTSEHLWVIASTKINSFMKEVLII